MLFPKNLSASDFIGVIKRWDDGALWVKDLIPLDNIVLRHNIICLMWNGREGDGENTNCNNNKVSN